MPTALHQTVWMRYITIHHTTSKIKRTCLDTMHDELRLNLIYELLLSMKSCCGILFERCLLELLHCAKNCDRIWYKYKLYDMTSGYEYELLQHMTNYFGRQLCRTWVFWKGAVKECVAIGNTHCLLLLVALS